jgi:hypothetical protein
MGNFLTTSTPATPKRRGWLALAEGRLSEEMKARQKFKFVYDPSLWEDGTCLVFECNIYEVVVDALRSLIVKNDENIKYFFMIDSIDGLILKGDMDKTFEESAKISGGPVILAVLMKKIALAMAKRGHLALFTSQVRSEIKLDPYSKTVTRQTSATGGNAALHYANYILEFEPRFTGDRILKDPSLERYDPIKNPYVGHFAKAIVKKSPNEVTNEVITYPVRYGRKNGTSIWVEKEILDILLMFELIVKNKAWYNFDEEFYQEVKAATTEEIPLKFQGEAKFEAFLSDFPVFRKFAFDYVKNLLVPSS